MKDIDRDRTEYWLREGRETVIVLLHGIGARDPKDYWQFQALLKKLAPAANGKAEPTPGSMPAPPTAVPHSQTAKSSTELSPMPQVAPKPTQPCVGQRVPGRDPVGEMSALSVRKSAGCAFTQVIEVTLAQLEETGVSRLECPTCLAMREIKPKGNHVKFPAHPKRITATPNQGARWVKRATAWKLFDA
jgi:hypothetical protein